MWYVPAVRPATTRSYWTNRNASHLARNPPLFRPYPEELFKIQDILGNKICASWGTKRIHEESFVVAVPSSPEIARPRLDQF